MAQKPNHPCIVVPGIKGTGLENIYAVPPAATWSLWDAAEQKFGDVDFESLRLNDAAEIDYGQDVVNRASQLLPIAYRSFAQALRGRSDFPVYLFPYDWRYSNRRSAEQLVGYVHAVQSKKMKGVPTGQWDKTFDFACHSMGGLVFRQFIAAWRAAWPNEPPPVNRVVFIATPHLGSLDAIEAMIRGETSWFDGRKELRKLARTFPGVYELLPNPKLPNTVLKNSAPLDFFDVHNWQETVTPAPKDFRVDQEHLDAALKFLNALPDVTDAVYGLAGKILVIYGSGKDTLRTVNVLDPHNGTKNWYDFDNAQKDDGDDVVLVDSAKLAGVPALEIRSSDVSLFNLKSHLLGSLHATLPSLDEVSSATSRFFAGVTGQNLLPKGMDTNQFHP